MQAFNLIDEKWIPCVMTNGEHAEMGISDALKSAHLVRELFDPSPLVTAALHRLLLAITMRILKPVNLAEWKSLWHNGKCDGQKIADYLARHKDRFFLFHSERPFYQCAEFAAKKTTPIKRLGWEFAAGNNATLFDHSWDDERPEIEPSIAARWIVATQCFAASAGKSETLHTKDSPWTRGAAILMQGDNLFETLALNLLSFIKPDFPASPGDSPIWEEEKSWKPAHDQSPAGILEYLTWQSRSIKLLPTENGHVRECYFAQGRGLVEGWNNEPMLAYRRDEKKGLMVWLLNENRAVWRDSHALLNLKPDGPYQIPQAIRHIAAMTLEGSLDQHRLYQLQVLGQALESGQPTIRFWRQERLPVRVEYLSEPLVIEQLGKALKLAEDAARVLQKSIRSLGQLLLAPDTHRQPDRKDVDNLTDGFGAVPHYWSQLEAPFKRLLIDLPSDRRTDEHDDVYYGEKELPRWARTLHDAATSAFTIVTRSLDTSSRSLKAVAAVEPQFRAGLRAALPDNFQTSTGGTQ